MGAKAYLDRLRERLDEVEREELAKIKALAAVIADRVVAGGAVHLLDHGHMLNRELFNRAGGLALLAGVETTEPGVSHQVRRRGIPGVESAMSEADPAFTLAWAAEVARRAAFRPDDVFVVGSVSGRSPFIVELALQAKARGVHTVALTALKYARTLPPLHPSGRLLYQVADTVLDIKTGVGDAEIDVTGVPEKMGPSSGVMAATVAWCLEIAVAEALVARGVVPTVYRSVNFPDGPTVYRAQRARYESEGV
jgi:uncharacterized phosphosugar-binding protein